MTTETQATWRVGELVQNDGSIAVLGPDGRIARVDDPANAPIVAAALELLEALRKAVQLAGQQYRGGEDVPMRNAWLQLAEQGEQAIRKAEGSDA